MHAYLIYLFPINTELVNPLEEYADFIAKVEWVSAYINTHTIRDLRQSSAMGWRYNAGLALIGAFVLIWVGSAEITQVCIMVFMFLFFFSFLPPLLFLRFFFMLFYFYVIGCVLKMLCFCKRRVGKQNLNFSNILNCMSVPSAISYWYNCEIDMQSKVGFCLLGLQCEINAGGRIFTFHCDYIMLNVKVFQNDTTTLNFIW